MQAGFMKDMGYASRELFTQFLVRLAIEIPNVTLAMFSKLKYVNAPNFEALDAKACDAFSKFLKELFNFFNCGEALSLTVKRALNSFLTLEVLR